MVNTTRRASLLLVSLALFLSACGTARSRADHAYELGKYNEALDEYEILIDEGTRDPEVYRRAARASVAIGGFSVAERYYSQALRYGGGVEVAQELGQFYIRTSNYASAARVYQYLLSEDNSQAVYNNLGTALMYAGKPFDAESYLMIAQQLEPTDPLPYLNLGLLYDQHLRQPWLAINFYECFTMYESERDPQSQEVRQRVQELRVRWDRLYDSTVLECGTAYSPRAQARKGDLKDLLGDGGEPKDTKDPGFEVGDPDGPLTPVEVDRMVEESPDKSPDVAKPVATPELATANRAFAEGKHQVVVRELSALSISSLDRQHKEMLGASLLELGRAKEAVSWLELAMNDAEAPSTVKLLISAYRQNSQEERVLEICSKYAYKQEYRDSTKTCERREGGKGTEAPK